MVFKKLKARFGGGTTVDTRVHTPVAQPGGTVEGVVEIVGGEFVQEIKYLELALVARVEVETDDGEHHADETFAKQRVTGAFPLHPGQRLSVPFQLGLPLETPFNLFGGRELHSVRIGVRTELEIAKSTDKGDFDPIRVAPLPAQERILAAFERVGCHFKSSDVERGRIRGAALPFYQEVEFTAPHGLRLKEVEVTFLAGPHSMEVLIEGDRKGGFLDSGGDRVHRFTVGYQAIDHEDWEAVVYQQLQELGRRRGLFG